MEDSGRLGWYVHRRHHIPQDGADISQPQCIWYQSKYWLDFRKIWTDWPSRDISGTSKWYCLLQLSFWLQQILVINIEERRKDHYQMLTHHIITSTLLFSAYVYSFYNVANVVLCIMDIVDFLLPVRKPTKFCEKSTFRSETDSFCYCG
jgi:acyl-CoA-dependent ceramide synthase